MRSITRFPAVLLLVGWANFASSATPIPEDEFITVNGKDWVQVDLFSNLSAIEIGTACPAGSCAPGSTLNGYDVSDLVWATMEEVAALYNHYLGSPVIGDPFNWGLSEVDSTWAPAFFADGWRGNTNWSPETIASMSGWTSSHWNSGIATSGVIDQDIGEDDMIWFWDVDAQFLSESDPDLGGWLYRRVPISDTVTVDGKEWAQVDLFLDLSWNQINAVCPGGTCGAGALNGYDMDGWRWASVDEVNALFNFYSTDYSLGPGPDSYYWTESTWAPAFFADGWNTTAASATAQSGWTSTSDAGSGTQAQAYYSWFEDHPTDDDTVATNQLGLRVWGNSLRGAWFYRFAGPSVDLVFSGTTGTGTTGTDTIRAKAGDVLTLDIVVTDNDALGICAAILSLYWDAAVLTGSNAESCPSPPNAIANRCNDPTGVTYDPGSPVSQSAGAAENFVTAADCLGGGSTLGFFGESMVLGRTQLLVETTATGEITVGYIPSTGIYDDTLAVHNPEATATILPPGPGC